MDQNGNTVFQPSPSPVAQTSVPQQPQIPPQPATQVPPPQPIIQTPQPVGAMEPPVSPIPPSLPPSDAGMASVNSSFPFGKILKIFAGLLIIGVIAVLIIAFVLPLFQNKNEKVTLTYWGLWEDPAVMDVVLKEFTRQHPNITVSYEKRDVDDYKDRLLTRIDNNNGPDLFLFHNSWLPEVKNYVAPLPSSVMTPESFNKIYYPVMQKDVIKKGAIYGIPLNLDTIALFINNDELKAADLQPPSDWKEFGDAARTLTVKDESGKIQTAGAALGAYDNITHAPDILSMLFLQNGSNLYDLNVIPPGQDKPKARSTLDYYFDYSKSEASVWDDTLDKSYLAFARGNLAMYFGYSWDIFMIKAVNPDLNFSIVPVPHLPSPAKPLTIASYWVQGVSGKSKHQKESMLLLEYLSRKETVQKLYTEASKRRLFGELYARKDLAETLKDNALVYPFVSQGPIAASSFFASDTHDNGLNTTANGYLGDAVRGIYSGQKSTQSALDELTQHLSELFQKYGI